MLVFTSSSNWFIWFLRSRLKWLNSPVKSTEYRRERELDNSEPTLIKDRKPERENKDDEVNHFSFSFCWEKVSLCTATPPISLRGGAAVHRLGESQGDFIIFTHVFRCV